MTPRVRFRSGYFSTAPAFPETSSPVLLELAPGDLDEKRSPVFAGRSERFRRRLGQGHRLFAIRADGRVATYLWLSEARSEVPLGLGVSFLVPEGMSYVWDCRTDQGLRGRGLYRQGLEALRRITPAGGALLIAVEYGNGPAIAAMSHAGFRGACRRYRIARLGPAGLFLKDGSPQFFLGSLRAELTFPLQERSGFSTT